MLWDSRPPWPTHTPVVLTDLPEVCPLLQSNAREYPEVVVRPLAGACAAQTQALRGELSLIPVSQIRIQNMQLQHILFAAIWCVESYSSCIECASMRSDGK